MKCPRCKERGLLKVDAVGPYLCDACGWERGRKPYRAGRKPGRNESCICGSGEKWKKCCGKPAR